MDLQCSCSSVRHELNRKKNKVDEYIRKPKVHSAHILGDSLSRLDNNDDFKDEVEKALSKSLGGGSMNVCKTRVITLVHQERVVQGLLYSTSHLVFLLYLSIYLISSFMTSG